MQSPGVDFTGPLYVRSERGKTKCYICLFSCAVTRAVLLEVVSDLTERSFLQAFRRFTSRKSLPYHMLSDNVSTYLSAAEELEKLFQSPSLSSADRTLNGSLSPKEHGMGDFGSVLSDYPNGRSRKH